MSVSFEDLLLTLTYGGQNHIVDVGLLMVLVPLFAVPMAAAGLAIFIRLRALRQAQARLIVQS